MFTDARTAPKRGGCRDGAVTRSLGFLALSVDCIFQVFPESQPILRPRDDARSRPESDGAPGRSGKQARSGARASRSGSGNAEGRSA